MNKINLIYNKLYKSFGPQHWWPVTSDNARLEIIIGAILTQNTAWKNVKRAIENLKKNNLINIKKINHINRKELANLIKSSGYYNEKAKKLKNIANFLSKNSIERFKKLSIEELRKKLLEIKGIGPETADSMILYAFNKPIFVIDAYTKRIFERLGYKQRTYDELQKLFHKNLESDYKIFNEYHALLVELGKNYCKKKPDCEKCPIIKCCNRN